MVTGPGAPVFTSPATWSMMLPMKRLHRYILREIATPLLLGLATFTAVLLMGRMLKLADMVIAKGVPLRDILLLVMYLLPYFAIFTIPMAFLLAVLLGFGRLSADSEVTAMKACGLSLSSMLPPVLLAGLVAYLATTFIALYALPRANTAFKELLQQVVESRINLSIKPQVFNDDIPGLVLYTDRFDERTGTMHGILVHDDRNREAPTTIFAKAGTLRLDQRHTTVILTLEQGNIQQLVPGKAYRQLGFASYQLAVNLTRAGREIARNELDMDLDEIRKNLRTGGFSAKLMKDMELEVHRRFALPFACFVFAVVGLPLGIQNQRSGKGAGFAVSIGVLLAYYIAFSASRTLGEKDLLHPALAMWLPNGIFLVIGLLFFRQASEEQRILPSLRYLTRFLPRRGDRA